MSGSITGEWIFLAKTTFKKTALSAEIHRVKNHGMLCLARDFNVVMERNFLEVGINVSK